MATSRLQLYNAALTICGERHLASLTENRKPRRLLDHVWSNDGVKACLEAGQWKFAIRTIRLDYETAITPDYGYRRAFAKPSDWCVTSAVSADEYFITPLTRYVDERGYWYADLDELYVRFVSNGTGYGGDLSLWPARFTDYAAAAFAAKIVMDLTQDTGKRNDVLKLERMRLDRARSTDAMAGPTQFPARGAWSSARSGRGSTRERGNRGSLIG